MNVMDIFYLCDRKACENCHEECQHTSDIHHAIHKEDLAGRLFLCGGGGERFGLFEFDGLRKEM